MVDEGWIIGRKQQILGRADLRKQVVDRLFTALGHQTLEQRPLILLTGNRKGRADPDGFTPFLEQLRAKGMKGLDRQPRRRHRAQQTRQPLTHLFRRLVGKGDRQHRLWRNPFRLDQMGHAHRQRARLPRPRSGYNDHRLIDHFHCDPLALV